MEYFVLKGKLNVLVLLSLLIGCSNPVADQDKKLQQVVFNLNLPQDGNGFYRLELVNTEEQTVHRIDGYIYPPIEYKRIEWWSNLQYTVGPLSANITNTRSYTNSDGEFSNVIGPMKSMKGDTMVLAARWDSKLQADALVDYYPVENEVFYIILE